MRQFLLCVCVFIVVLSPYRADATHIVGGEVYYQKLNGNDYMVTLKVYRDCGATNTLGTGFDQNAQLGIYRGSLLYQTVGMPLAFAQVSVVPVVLENPCFVPPPGVCVQEAVYTTIVNLPPHVSGYVLMHQRCCRNPSIININFPDESGATFWTQIPGSNLTTQNSNPQFNSLPPVALCAGAEFVFDHSATDIDGDSLAYEFCTPLLGGSTGNPAPTPGPPPPYAPVNWAAGYNGGYQIASDPPFTIDPITGLMSGTPTIPGQFVIGVCVSEYRNGVLLSTTNRDFQFNVTLCEPVVSVTIPEQDSFCDGLTFSFSQNSINASSFLWHFGDPMSDNDWSTEASPTYTYSDTGAYVVTLIANPGWTCADTVSTIYQAFPAIDPTIVEGNYTCVNQQGVYGFNAGGEFTDNAQYVWVINTPGGDVVSNLQNVSGVTVDPQASFTVNLTVFDNGCESAVTQTIVPPPAPIASVPPQETFCGGLSYQFENMSQHAETFIWDFGLPGGSATSTEVSPEYTYADTGIYTITLTAMAPGTCPDVTTTTLDVYWLLDPWFEPPGGQCFGGHALSFQGFGTEESTAIYSWEFGGSANQQGHSGQNTGLVIWQEPGTYDVTLTVQANGCIDSVTWPVELIPDPIIHFTGGGEGCPSFIAHFTNLSFTATTATYVWNFGDGSTSTLANPYHIYSFPGTFDVSLTMTTGGGCVQTLNMVLPNAVQSYPLPLAGLDIEPNVVDILEPHITIIDLSVGSVSCHYYFGDGTTSTDCNPSHSYNASGYFDVVQTVTNEFGCTAKGYGQVLVEGSLFYAPNAFTPDGDGINDVWRPVVTGYTRYDISIYNRWGEVIFRSDTPEEPWFGNVKGGDHYAQDGIYLYKCVMHDLRGLPHVFEGHINLIR